MQNTVHARNNHVHRRGFTLLELLCVLLILCVLATLLMPAFNLARSHALKTSCQSNLRQLGSSFHLYGGDYNMHFPARNLRDLYADGGINWGWYFLPYYQDTRLLDCPVSPEPAPSPTRESLHLNNGNYGWNFSAMQGKLGAYCDRITAPSQCYFLFDSGDPCIFREGAPNWIHLMEELDLDFDSKLEGPNRHRNEVNALFLDLHCERRSLLAFLSMPNMRNSSPWFQNWDQNPMPLGVIPYAER